MGNGTEQYQKARVVEPLIVFCKSSTVDPLTPILMNGVEHAGLTTHKCNLEEKHESLCQCACGHIWQKNFK